MSNMPCLCAVIIIFQFTTRTTPKSTGHGHRTMDDTFVMHFKADMNKIEK